MGGGLLQLVTKGEHDAYFTGNPEVSYFKMMYKRYTNFGVETIELMTKEQPIKGRLFTFTLPKQADLLKRIWLNYTIPGAECPENGSFKWVEKIGHALLEYVEVEIGGQVIDKHYADYFEMYSELNIENEAKQGAYRYLIGDITYMTEYSNQKDAFKVHIPLLFWFGIDGLELPLIALQHHDVKINVKLRDIGNLYNVRDITKSDLKITNADIDCSLFVEYIYLDAPERKFFAESSHKYMIMQLQYNGDFGMKGQFLKVPIYFNHPVRELWWFLQPEEYEEQGRHFRTDYSVDGFNTKSLMKSCKMIFNGIDFTDTMPWEYYNLMIPYNRYPRAPKLGVNVFSFCLNPRLAQPSGTLNMSRIENATLHIETIPEYSGSMKVKVYAVNHNVLNIKGGMGFLEFI